MPRNAAAVLTAFVLAAGFGSRVAAQDLTPRAYWPTPKGTKVAIIGYSHVRGDVFFDPSVPLSGVDSKIHTGLAAFLQTFSLWGRTATIVVDLPYSWGTTEGLLEDEPARADYSGLGDLGATLSVNLLGAPSMTRADFQSLRAEPHLIVGASLKVIAPTGRYDDERLINVGANRWAARFELGSIVPLHRKWLLELDAGLWWFTDNDDFLTGTREQEPIYNVQAHLIRRFKPGFWASLDANYFVGGRQTIGGDELGDVLHNVRVGGMVVVPFGGRHAIKAGYFIGARTSFGADFDQLLVTYQVLLD